MTNKEIMQIALQQSAYDCNCKPEDFLFEGNLNDLYKELMGHDITDILIEEPSLDEIFMKFYINQN